MRDDLKTLFGMRIRALREEKGWTCVDAANLMGISTRHLYKLEYGQREPSLTSLGRIAEVYGVDEFDLFIWPSASVRHDVVELLRPMSADALEGLKKFLRRMSQEQEGGDRLRRKRTAR